MLGYGLKDVRVWIERVVDMEEARVWIKRAVSIM